MSFWNVSDCRFQPGQPIVARQKLERRGGLALRGTIKEMGSTSELVTLNARPISQSLVLSARRGSQHMPRCGSFDEY